MKLGTNQKKEEYNVKELALGLITLRPYHVVLKQSKKRTFIKEINPSQFFPRNYTSDAQCKLCTLCSDT